MPPSFCYALSRPSAFSAQLDSAPHSVKDHTLGLSKVPAFLHGVQPTSTLFMANPPPHPLHLHQLPLSPLPSCFLLASFSETLSCFSCLICSHFPPSKSTSLKVPRTLLELVTSFLLLPPFLSPFSSSFLNI